MRITASPILLGESLRAAKIPGAERYYGIVVVQGSLTPAARWLRIPMRTREPAPWALGVRLRHEPEHVHRLTIAASAPADGRTIEQVASLAGDLWISLVVRDSRLLPVTGRTQLHAGDEVLVLADPETLQTLNDIFGSHPAPD